MTDEAWSGRLAPPSKLHFNGQEAGALLGPIVASLRVLELRVERFGHVATLTGRDAAAIAATHAALTTARAEVERLWLSGPAEREGGRR